jgi:hypothetical protein
VQPGTFVELAREWRAGEDYHGWSEDPAWTPYRGYLEGAQRAVEATEHEDADPGLVALAWKHLLASSYETAWRDTSAPDAPVAPWSKALASHARACSVLVAAARWFGRAEFQPYAELVDVDGDGEDELVMANRNVFAVVAPRHGGRLVYLTTRSEHGAALVVGNPSDDWNWQESLNRYMDEPANHPGALADGEGTHDRYDVTVTLEGDDVIVDMVDVEPGSAMSGTRKRILLEADSQALAVGYDVPPELPMLTVEVCLSTDYYSLLRNGRRDVRRFGGRTVRGMRSGTTRAWVALAGDEETSWHTPRRGEVGHGLVVEVCSRAPSFHLLIGVGDVDEEGIARQMKCGREALTRFSARTTAQRGGPA